MGEKSECLHRGISVIVTGCERKILNACNFEALGVKEHQHLKTP